MSITDNWTGFFLNHLVDENHPNYLDKFLLPNEIDWKLHLAPQLYLEAEMPVDVRFLWAYKVLKLHVDPESESRTLLPQPVPIVVIKYDYGEFDRLQPQKQDLILCSYYRASLDDEIELVEYKRIKNNLVRPGAKEKLEVARRVTAEAFIKQRAKEIDSATSNAFALYGKSVASDMGFEQLNLSEGIKNFFSEFNSLVSIYISSGSLKIVDKIFQLTTTEIEDLQLSWLVKNIPIGMTSEGVTFKIAREEIARIFTSAVTPVTMAEIDGAIRKILIQI